MRRFILWLLVLIILGLPLAFAAVAVQTQPFLPETSALSPQTAAGSRALVSRLRRTARETQGVAEISATAAEIDGLIATAARAFPGLRGRTTIDEARITIAASFPLPPGGGSLWINAGVRIPASPLGIEPSLVRLGRVDLPPELALTVLVALLDWATTDDVGTLLVESVQAVRTAPQEVTALVDTGGTGEDNLFSRAAAGAREAAGLDGGEAARAHFAAMAAAAARGDLPSEGSALPWLRFALARVAAAGHPGPLSARPDVRAALLALAAHCGDRSAMETVAGKMAPGTEGTGSACSGATLGGRDDLRKHFTLSAAFAAAGGSSVSWGLGEVKELVDAGRAGGSGFSFDDVAADRAGIAFAEQALGAGPRGLSWMLSVMGEEGAVMPSIEGLPSFMSEPEFAARYGDVEDPRYDAQIEEIDGRIAALEALSR
ncbi:MAG: hypothetical protein AAGI51_13445 [Pseudomonadota bacterium]